MYKLIAITLLVILVLVLGCIPSSIPEPPVVETPDKPVVEEPEDRPTGVVSVPENPVMVEELDEMPKDPTISWIHPGKMFIWRMAPGRRAEYVYLIHNGTTEVKTYEVSPKLPNQVVEGFKFGTPEMLEWLSFEPDVETCDCPGERIVRFDVAPLSTRKVLGILEIPLGTEDLLRDMQRFEIWSTILNLPGGGKPGKPSFRWAVDNRWIVTTEYYLEQ